MKAKTIVTTAILLAAWSMTVAAAPIEKLKDGAVRQKASGVIFPGQVASFVNRGYHSYDEKGLDVSVKYLFEGLIIADVYCYPAGRAHETFDREFAKQQGDIRSLNKKVTLLSQSATSVTQNGRVVQGRQATYNLERKLYGSKISKAESQFLLFRDGPWLIAYRFSYPREQAPIARTHARNFVSRWSWRGR